MSYAQLGVRADLDPTTVHKLAKTGRGDEDTVTKLATAFEEDVDHWLRLAGHRPSPGDAVDAIIRQAGRGSLEAEAALEAAAAIVEWNEGLRRLSDLAGEPIAIDLNPSQLRTRESVRKLLAAKERQLRERGVIRD